MRKFYVTLFFIVCHLSGFSQNGAVQGILTESDKVTVIPFATIVLELNGVISGGSITDLNGKYSIKPVLPGRYTLRASFIGFQPFQVNNVLVSVDKITFLDIILSKSSFNLKTVEIIEYEIPLISKDNTQTGAVFSRDQIANAATRDINSLASQTAGVSQQDDGKDLNMRGQRSEGTYYIIDGVKVRGSSSLPQSSIDQISVITGGIPAQYGDVTGGIINITTRGPSKKFTGSMELVSSEKLDQFGYNLVGFNFSGPLFTRKKSDSLSRPLLGFSFSGEIQYDKDASPSAVGSWKVNDDKLKFLQENPLQRSPRGQGFVRNSEFLTASDFDYIAARQNVASNNFRLNSKVNFQVQPSLLLVLGGNWDRDNGRAGVYTNTLLNTDNNPSYKVDSWRLFLRMTQKFSEKSFLTFQLDYSKVLFKEEDVRHKENVFDYGYIGRFKTHKANAFEYKKDTVNGKSITAWYMTSADRDTGYTFQAGQLNPLASNYTSQLYSYSGSDIRSSKDVQNGGGLLNGENPKNIYSLWNNTGHQGNSYSFSNKSQLRATMVYSRDIQNHTFTIGGEIEQRIDKGYSTNSTSIWSLMRQLSNRQISQLDKAHGHVVYDANHVLKKDTVYYDRLFLDSLQSTFDKNVRKALNLPVNGKEWIDIDSYAPSFFKMNMFSPDELLNNGKSYSSYYGYDYTGASLLSQSSFNDYFTKKDVQGNYMRQVGAFAPIYMAGFIQDKFSLNDLVFNVGVRVDRYDANQKVLRDNYSLFPVLTAGDQQAIAKVGVAPSSIGSDFAVYADDLKNPSKALGYRHLDQWYNSQGIEISDPKSLAEGTTSGKITPLLKDPTASLKTPGSYDPSAGFTDYKPQYNLMPRIQFSFPISDEAQFFAHYDVLTQRPLSSLSRMDPFQYLWLESIATDAIISNPNLKPERTTDYELGFQQKVSKSAVLSISTYYREMRDMVQIVAVNYAYPTTYKSYGNRDFGTVKGFKLTFELRRTDNIRLTANYSLQFAEGTGSSTSSGYNLIASGIPNLRTPIPLDFDQRHNIVISFDYRYSVGSSYNGPIVRGRQILAGTGLNIVFRTGSGVPYTQQGIVTEGDPSTQNVVFGVSQKTSLKGDINGSRLPWQLKMDARLDKDFRIVWNKKAGQEKKYAMLNVYLLVQNVLNTPNIIKVYSYTGNANDDGYLASPEVQNAIKGQLSEQSFRDYYAIKVNDPSNYSLPRRIRLGLIMNF